MRALLCGRCLRRCVDTGFLVNIDTEHDNHFSKSLEMNERQSGVCVCLQCEGAGRCAGIIAVQLCPRDVGWLVQLVAALRDVDVRRTVRLSQKPHIQPG